MNKFKTLIIATSGLFCIGSATLAVAEPSTQTCLSLVSIAQSGSNLSNSALSEVNSDINACLAQCSTLYGNSTNPTTLKAIANCRSRLSSLKFDSDYSTALKNNSGSQNQQADAATSNAAPQFSASTASQTARQQPTNTNSNTTTAKTKVNSPVVDPLSADTSNQNSHSSDSNSIRWF